MTDLLIEENKIHNLTHTDPTQILFRHILDSLIALKFLIFLLNRGVVYLVDIGSGWLSGPAAGGVRPDWKFLSIEATGKRRLQQRHAGRSDCSCSVLSAGGSDHDRRYRQRCDAVLARAVANLSVLAELSLGFVKIGGRLIAERRMSPKNSVLPKDI